MQAAHGDSTKAHRATLNLTLVGFVGALNLLVLLGLPLVADPGAAWSLPVAMFVLLVNAHWALIHEAMHGLLYPGSDGNARLGRALSVLFGAPFRLLRYGHLLHHRLARHSIDADGTYDPARRGRLSAAAGHYLHLFGGLYLLELASSLLVFLPERVLRRIAAASLSRPHDSLPGQRRVTGQQLLSRASLRELRVDGAAAMSLFGLGFVAYAEHWPVLVGLLAARGLIVSLTDSSFHYRPPAGAAHQSMNFSLPRPLCPLVLNFNYHRVHHRHPGRPWYELPALSRRDRDHADCAWSVGLMRQLRGPVAVTGPRD